ncbi:methyltransferase domain-containing protein [Hydrogenovibrio halophilus]|uniref:methyltransferase domain-containing protein n=1 Tax=Hydrogenovibrio halophilus TaxID=373391 RepID=UPI000365FB4A|nr:methyltransferase domain-containing protein [Hydrogenovibrio halophilus]
MTNTAFQSFLLRWFQLKNNRSLLRQEQILLSQALSHVFGLYLVQLGRICPHSMLEGNRARHHILMDQSLTRNAGQKLMGIEADIDYLPLKPDSVDAVVLPHTLESVLDPYHLLRQIDQVLIPEGHLIVTGFNPWGCLTLRHRLGEHRQAFGRANLIRAHRLVDWLSLLGYDIEWINYTPVTCFGKPSDKRVTAWQQGLDQGQRKPGQSLGNLYCLHAKKRVSAPTPVGLNWRLTDWLGLKRPGPVAANPSREGYDGARCEQKKKLFE